MVLNQIRIIENRLSDFSYEPIANNPFFVLLSLSEDGMKKTLIRNHSIRIIIIGISIIFAPNEEIMKIVHSNTFQLVNFLLNKMWHVQRKRESARKLGPKGG